MDDKTPTATVFLVRVVIVLVLGLAVPPWAVLMMSYVQDHRDNHKNSR